MDHRIPDWKGNRNFACLTSLFVILHFDSAVGIACLRLDYACTIRYTLDTLWWNVNQERTLKMHPGNTEVSPINTHSWGRGGGGWIRLIVVFQHHSWLHHRPQGGFGSIYRCMRGDFTRSWEFNWVLSLTKLRHLYENLLKYMQTMAVLDSRQFGLWCMLFSLQRGDGPFFWGGGGRVRLSTSQGDITDCKLDSVVHAGVCGCRCGELIWTWQCLVWRSTPDSFRGLVGGGRGRAVA